MPRTARIKVETERVVEVAQRWFVGHGVTSFGSSATGHTHEAIDGNIDCAECAAANNLPSVDVEVPGDATTFAPEGSQVASAPGVAAVPTLATPASPASGV